MSNIHVVNLATGACSRYVGVAATCLTPNYLGGETGLFSFSSIGGDETNVVATIQTSYLGLPLGRKLFFDTILIGGVADGVVCEVTSEAGTYTYTSTPANSSDVTKFLVGRGTRSGYARITLRCAAETWQVRWLEIVATASKNRRSK